ncbi:tyrosinase family protein [Burkholderia ubonensis]|uniref:tyrosinase family protein n=1 Tax=Burkholderia ubonensis TaxID=101571 RepID=UPI0039F56609
MERHQGTPARRYPNSFFLIGGFHGEPFRGAGWGSSSYWGGYCNHGNVLFPTLHRVYLLRLEQALQSIPGCEQVMLPYWDETSDESLKHGIPWAPDEEGCRARRADDSQPAAFLRVQQGHHRQHQRRRSELQQAARLRNGSLSVGRGWSAPKKTGPPPRNTMPDSRTITRT